MGRIQRNRQPVRRVLVSGEHRTQVTDFEPVTDTQWFIAPTFSGDGHTVYFHLPRIGSLGFDVWSVPVTGGEPKLLLENAAQPVSIPAQNYWGAFVPAESDTFDGSIVLATRDRSVLVETEGSIDRPSASPDGSKIVFGLERFAGSDMRDIYVVDVSTGELSKVARGNMASWLDNDTLVIAVHNSVG